MQVRTISLLPRLENITTDEGQNSLMEVSVPATDGSNLYISKSVKVNTVYSNLSTGIYDQLVDDFDMQDPGKNNISLSTQAARISSILWEDSTFNGVKQFTRFPYISTDFPIEFSAYDGNENYIIPNIDKVIRLVRERNPVCISTTSSYVAGGCPFINSYGNPLSDDVQIRFNEETGTVDDGFYMWKIKENGKDSSHTIWDPISKTTVGYQCMRDTGNLVVWGWLSDKGDVLPQNAWVGIFARMKYEGNDLNQIWVPLQIQPWIKGTNSSSMQYVGFNVPVKAGLEIKIKTGFVVGGDRGAPRNTIGSISFMNGNIPNAFFGYVIKNM